MRLSTLRVVAPCHADWDAMSGGARARHCEHCRLQVRANLDRHEAEAIAEVLRRAGAEVRVK